MAVRQYIGARYVPRFLGNYDATQVYEALDVVDNGMGTSYIAKIPTPAGTPLTNTTYWAIYGASSGAIINLQNQIGDLTELDTTDQDNLVDAINELHTDIEELDDKFYIFIGDSYNTTDTPGGGVPIVPWGEKVAEYMGLSSDQYINSGVSGAGFVNGTTFLTQLQNLTLPVSDDKVTDIIVCGGVNDISQINSVEPAINTFVNYVNGRFQNSRITLGMISWTIYPTEYPKHMTMNLIYETQRRARVRVIPQAFQAFHLYKTQYQSDGHPNASGSYMIASMISNYLKGLDFKVGLNGQGELQINSSPAYTITSINHVGYYQSLCGDVASITFNDDTLEINTPSINFVCGGPRKLLNLNSDVMRPRMFQIGCQVVFNCNGTYIASQGMLRVVGDDVYLSAIQINDAGTSYKTITGVTQILINLPSIVLPISDC